MNALQKALAIGGLLISAAAATGCTTDGFCFANCEKGSQPLTDSGAGNGTGGGDLFPAGTGGCTGLDCPGAGDAQVKPPPCTATPEVCDGKDNDCDGKIDEPGKYPDGIDFANVHTCGSCAVNCVDPVINPNAPKNVVTPKCNAVPADGTTPGTCDYQGGCAPNTYDIDSDRSNGCEYTCIWNPNGTNTVDLGGAFGCNKDDDCNGKVDDGLNFCTDPDNCGGCGITCTLPNTVTASCVSSATNGAQCDANNTKCAIAKCTDGFYDADGEPSNGCEYPCTPSGPEVCDGKDNDCDGKVDNEDPDLENSLDPADTTNTTKIIGEDCAGGDKGICAANRGIKKCIDGLIKCCDQGSNNTSATDTRYPQTGLRNDECVGATEPHVYVPGQLQEICNDTSGGTDPRFDDDCDGVIDGPTIESGGVCGNALGTCTTGHNLCVGGKLACIGATGPMLDPNDNTRTIDPCNGSDDDCDGVIDGTKPATKLPCTTNANCTTAPNFLCAQLSADPTDRGCVAPSPEVVSLTTGAPLACNVPPAPPNGATQPCKAGTMACFGGVPECTGSITKPQDTDKCGDDTNCNGTLDNQANLGPNDDVKNCGACGNDCTALGTNGSWACQAGKCVKTGCQAGFIHCTGSANNCETACTFQQTAELCDGIDNNCNCQVDEGTITPPSVNQACGINSAATDPGCSSKVALACTNGGWKCTFTDPAYCTSGNCATTPDICDGKDNNCDGVADEGFKPPALLIGFLGQGCFSDDGKPAPGDGPCRTQGQFICNPAGSATMCSASKDLTKKGTEVCDGVDNDCNGVVDDPLAVASQDPRINQARSGDIHGICGLGSHAGKNTCVNGAVSCAGPNVLHPGDKLETCNNADDDCDGIVDNHLTDTGGSCGSGVGECKLGTQQCLSGVLKCNDTGPTPEICDGKDNNCNGQIDDSPTDVGTACDAPTAPPSGATSPCKAGVYSCIGSAKVCTGSIKAVATTDSCGDDSNCDGKLTNQTALNNSDVFNCGACGHDCNALDPTGNSVWACTAGACVHSGCKTGFIDCDGNLNTCEQACTITSSTEICNGKDDNCDCKIDNAVTPATPVQVCGVSPSATDVGCTTGITTACVSGAWKCTFPTDYCTTGNCSTTVEKCDGEDNNCDGNVDETFKAPILASGFLGQACATPTSDGPCQGTGTYVCNGAKTGTQCNATTDTTKKKAETCNGVDDDCNGTIDDAAGVSANDVRVGKQCFGGTQGECAAAGHAGSTVCQSGSVVCTGALLLSPNKLPETCNNKDDDCNGIVDDNPTDVGQSCGNGVGACVPGKIACVSGAPVCQGAIAGSAEKCNGIDDDCNGVTDNSPSDAVGDCNVPPAAPAPTPQCATVVEPCKKGSLACTGGVTICSGSTTASPTAQDKCCEDTNCDGTLTNQPNFQTDVANCGGCGNDCNALNAGKHGIWACVAGACQRAACAPGFINCDAVAGDCERACTPGGAELCNGVDDDCNCTADDNIVSVPLPVQVCGVSSSASDVNCKAGNGTTGIAVQCTAGAWTRTFPAGYCDKGAPASCGTTPDICDGKDNNCDGNADQNQKLPILTTGYLNQPCRSDDGKPYPGDGQCFGTGTYVCNGPNATICNAVKNTGAATAETCDGADNDCDGLVDEPYSNKGTNSSFVAPAVVFIPAEAANPAKVPPMPASPAVWMYQFEASRPNATAAVPGTGDGYWCASGGTCPIPAPAGVTLDKTAACSVSGKIPWFNVTPAEVEQTCQAMGGFVCTTPEVRAACHTSAAAACNWGYGTGCTTRATYAAATNFCNLGGFNFGGVANADGLLPTASDNPPGAGPLQNCFANLGTGIFDLTGNLREITKRGANDYPLMGGAFDTTSDDGAACDFDFYSVPSSFNLYDTGFRCCFSSDPTL